MPITEPGIYFGLPEDEHHAIEAVGSSALRDMLIDPLTCWVRHVDPKRKPREDTPATIRGRAYHAMLLEGTAAFEARFARALVREEHEVLWSFDDYKRVAREMGITPGKSITDTAARIVEAGGNMAQCGCFIEEEHAEENEGKTILPADDFDQITRAAEIMEANGVRKAFEGGAPEVTIVWTDEKTGLLCKARIDYLKPAAALDLKSFANKMGKPLAVAVAQTFIFERYHVQAYHYAQGIEHAKKNGLPMFPGSHSKHSPFVDKPHDFFIVFRQTGDVPNVVVRRFAQRVGGDLTGYYRTAAFERDLALSEYKRHLDAFGRDEPWTAAGAIADFDDSEFPSYMIDQ
jgi:hypothetical protein